MEATPNIPNMQFDAVCVVCKDLWVDWFCEPYVVILTGAMFKFNLTLLMTRFFSASS